MAIVLRVDKACLAGKVPCGRKGAVRNLPGCIVTPCRNRWGCRYQVDLTDVPMRDRAIKLRAITIF